MVNEKDEYYLKLLFNFSKQSKSKWTMSCNDEIYEEELEREIGKCKLYTMNTIIIIGISLMCISFVLFIVGVCYRGTPVHDPLVISAIATILVGAILSFTFRFILLCISKKCCCFASRCCCFNCCKCCFKKSIYKNDEEKGTLINDPLQ